MSNFFKGYINIDRGKHAILLNKGINMEVLANSTKEVNRRWGRAYYEIGLIIGSSSIIIKAAAFSGINIRSLVFIK